MKKRGATARCVAIDFARIAATVAIVMLCIGGLFNPTAVATPIGDFRDAVNTTRHARSFVFHSQLNGYHPPDAGDYGPITLIYQAPNRFHSVQRLAGDPGNKATIIQLGSDHYQQDGSHAGVWTHNTLPAGELGWGSFFNRMFDTLASAQNIQRSGTSYQFAVPSSLTGQPGTGRATVADGHLVSLDVRTGPPGKSVRMRGTWSRFDSAPSVHAPTGTVRQEG